MPRFIVATLKFIAIVFTPIAVIGFAVSKRKISGDQYSAVLEIFGNDSRPGAIEIFGTNIQTISTLLNFFGTWSLPALVAMSLSGFIALYFSKDRLKSTWRICLGLFFSFGIWALFLTQSRAAFTEFLSTSISDLSAVVIAAYLSELSAELLNLTGMLALLFGALGFGFWALAHRRKVSATKALN